MVIVAFAIILTSFLMVCDSGTYVLPYDETRATSKGVTENQHSMTRRAMGLDGPQSGVRPPSTRQGQGVMSNRKASHCPISSFQKCETPATDGYLVFENGMLREYSSEQDFRLKNNKQIKQDHPVGLAEPV
ncbi:uncharacterized protein LOC126832997 [Adelges cooleyi]|uniref:uncharacterized protein LOC126832997 n=1 Tax=Adelges cooleyi TaxID=133065 RepID=UPI00217F42B1|nr:uncharacterized protein LOC126832997 [Adelges cooleyi]